MQDTSSLKPVRSGQHTDHDAPHTGFVRQACAVVPMGPSTLWRRVKPVLFCACPVSVGITAWRAEDVRHWIAEQK